MDTAVAANTGVMIALLPSNAEWCEIDLPHLTLVYAGTTDKLQPSDHNTLAKDAAMLAMLTRPFSLAALDIQAFGGSGDPVVDVLRFRPSPELQAMRRAVEGWNASQHPFNPHVTIGPQKFGRDILDFPRVVTFDRITVGWGEDYMTFWLNKSY